MICEFYVSWNAWSAQSAGHASNRFIFFTIKPCVTWEPEAFLVWFWPLANLYASHKWNTCMWKKSNQLNLLFFLGFFFFFGLVWFCFVLFCFNNSNISSEFDIYPYQSQSLVLYNFTPASKQVPWVLNSGLSCFVLNTAIARPHLSSFTNNERCPKLLREKNIVQNWDHCITFWAFKITCQSKFTAKTCEIVKQNLSSVSLNQDAIKDRSVLKITLTFLSTMSLIWHPNLFYPELLFFFQVRNFPILNLLL